MGIVIADDTGAVRIVERQAIPNPVWDVIGNLHAPCVNLQPVTVILLDDLTVEFEQRHKSVVFVHGIVSSVDKRRLALFRKSMQCAKGRPAPDCTTIASFPSNISFWKYGGLGMSYKVDERLLSTDRVGVVATCGNPKWTR